MKIGRRNNLLLLLCSYFLYITGSGVNSLSYDYTASTECLKNPHKPQYNGGIIMNPKFDDGLKGWYSFGNAKIEHRESQGNKFIVVHTRNQSHDSVSQKLYLQKDNIYSFSAWIRVSKGNKVPVTATLKTSSGFKHAGSLVAKSHCWSFLKGGLSVDYSSPAEIYFESNDTSVEIWVDSISLQPFTESQWKTHQDQSIQKVRKSKVRIKVVDAQGRALPNATLSLQQRNAGFPFGCAINAEILRNPSYQAWFASRGFTVTTFENELKWYSTEPSPNHEDYSTADAMLAFANSHGLAVRGHNVFWDDPKYQPGWVPPLSAQQLSAAAAKRLASVVSRYRGRLVAWDVVNENLHNAFFESKLGKFASALFYSWAFRADPGTTMFLNDYNTIEDSGDGMVSPAKYLEKVREIQKLPGNQNGKLGIGLEAHFGSGAPNLGYIRSAVDVLAATGLPIWITELDVKSSPNQAEYLEQILRELHSHPGIKGIVIWSAWKPEGCWAMCLTDNNFHNLPTGDVVDKLLREWGFHANAVHATADASGHFETTLFHGDYDVKIDLPQVNNYNSTLSHSMSVDQTASNVPLIIEVRA